MSEISVFAYNELINEDFFKEKGFEYIDKVTVTLSAQRMVFNRLPLEGEGIEGQGLPTLNPPQITLG